MLLSREKASQNGQEVAWSRLTAEQFLSGCGQTDVIYDRVRAETPAAQEVKESMHNTADQHEDPQGQFIGVRVPKEEVIEMVRQMPDEIDIEELIYRLYVREKLEQAEEDTAAGRLLSAEEVRAQAAQWGR